MPFYMIQDNCRGYMSAQATTILVIHEIFVCQIGKSNKLTSHHIHLIKRQGNII